MTPAPLKVLAGSGGGVARLCGCRHLVSMTSPQLPGLAKTWAAAVQLFADPFYRNGPNDPQYIAARAAVLKFLHEKQAHPEPIAA